MKELNPIRRLHDILKEAVEQGDINHSAGNVLKQFINVNSSNEKIPQLIEFVEITSHANKTIQRLQKVTDVNHYLKPIQEIQRLVVDVGFSNKWSSYRNQIVSQNLIQLLGIGADVVDRETNESYRVHPSFYLVSKN